jgi:hypothetical protein
MKLYDTKEQTSDDLQQMELEKQQMKLYDKKEQTSKRQMDIKANDK